MKMQRLAFMLVIFLLSFTAEAQTSFSINYYEGKLKLNELTVSKNSTLQDIYAVTGAADRTVNGRGSEKTYFFDKSGITVVADKDGISSFALSFNTAANKSYATNFYVGTILYNGLEIHREMQVENFRDKENTSVYFKCQDQFECTGLSVVGGVKTLVAFKHDVIAHLDFIFLN